jgi:hypothetical protein
MRLQAYYTPEEIITNLYTPGGQFETEDGVEYKGPYHRYITNEIYTGAAWNPDTSRKLRLYVKRVPRDTEYEKLKPRLKTRFFKPQSAPVVISEADRKVGMIYRYLAQKINDRIITEINEFQFNAWQSQKIDPNLYACVKIEWYITGERDDQKKGISIQKGVVTKNLEQIRYAETVIPGIKTVLNNPLQFYSDNTFIIPVDINQ